ncbi:TadE/TadG family type IV pilus assembly protein [Sphingomonas soli]|uniref:TadE/TadG family type IV pilus assembly protein n=1 Tax=Sphingomonas soli TaxID=266127 RepID=UPI000837207D|nr:TadE/TadG family type IV pilus assembly protein [Sphingomonas soli]
MAAFGNRNGAGFRGFLTRLARDQRGNTLAMIAVALIPLLGIVGSAVDTARLYVVKVRLQQACDAGVLAGRKFMVTSASSTLDSNAATQAQNFFRNNFKTGMFASSAVTFTPSKTADNQVAGAASATVPMTLTSMMGFGDNTVSVVCEARFDVADLDVMFVLDTTGSMAYAASDTNMSGQSVYSYTRSDGTTGYYTAEKSNARIKALRTSVLNFYDTLAASADSTTKIRYGFVPYTSTVNVGKIIPSSFLNTDTHTYSSRVPFERNYGSSSSTTYTNTSQNTCNGYASRSPSTGYDYNNRVTYKTVSWTSSNGGRCVVTTQSMELMYRFGPLSVDISQFVLGGWVNNPSTWDSSTSKWQGCIEERDTTADSSFSQTSLPADLDPDLMPTDTASRWRPMWPDIIYERNNNLGTVEVTASTASGSSYESIASKMSSGYVSCGKEAKRLGVMSRNDVSNYLNDPDFRPMGGTYHDTGFIWGTRFLAPDGPFASDTAAWPGRKTPIRHLVFMTDGEMSPNLDIYGMYGYERYDRRVTGTNTSTQTARHNARFLAECEAAKNRNITVWVIAFGSGLTSELQQCASSSGNAFTASSDAQLNTAFQTIASRVAMLRVSK